MKPNRPLFLQSKQVLAVQELTFKVSLYSSFRREMADIANNCPLKVWVLPPLDVVPGPQLQAVYQDLQHLALPRVPVHLLNFQQLHQFLC